VTFVPHAQFDPNALEAAVREVDFTPTSVTVWLRGAVNTDDLPPVGASEVAAWLVDEGTGQRFLLVASDDAGKAAIAAAHAAPHGSIRVYGKATRDDNHDPVSVRVEGTGETE